MTVLLALTMLLLLVSGVVKLRTAERTKMGLHLFSLLEIFAGVAVAVLMLGGPLTAGQGMAAVAGSVALVLGSSIHLGRRLKNSRRLRGLTEGRRLENYVKYLSNIPEEPGAGDDDPSP